MSFNSEHMETVGMVRGGTAVITLPPQTEENDKIMKQPSWGLYGNTRYTDAQILYFMVKHNGNMTATSKELGASYMTVFNRVKRIPQTVTLKNHWKKHGLKELWKKNRGRPKKADVKLDETKVMQDINNGMTNVAIALKYGVSKVSITQFKQKRGLSVPTRESSLFTSEELVRAYINLQGNRTKMAKFFGCSWFNIDYHCKSLNLPRKDCRMPLGYESCKYYK